MQRLFTNGRSSLLRRGLQLGFFVLMTMASPVFASSIIMGGTNGNNIAPFGNVNYLGQYQQVYSSSEFSGPTKIGAIAFQTLANVFNPTTPQSVEFSLGLSNTTATPSAMSSNYAVNRGANFIIVYAGTLTYTPASDGTFDFVIPIHPFTYDPGAGNLLIDINVTTPTTNQVIFLAGTETTVGRVYNLSGNGPAAFGPNEGLYTEFTVLPEPSTFALAGLGGLGLAFSAYRRSARHMLCN